MSSVKSVQLDKKLEKRVNELSKVKDTSCLSSIEIATNVDTTKQFNPLTLHADRNMQAISTSRKQQKTNSIITKDNNLITEIKSRSIQKLNNEANIGVTQCAKPKVISKLKSQSTTRKLQKQNTVDNKKKKSDIHMKGNSTSAQLSMLPADNPIKSAVALTQLNQGNSKYNIMRNLAAVINAEKLNTNSCKNLPGASTHFHDSDLSYNIKNCASTDQLYNMIASYNASQAYSKINEKIYASAQQRLRNPAFSIESAIAFNPETSRDVICYGIQTCPRKPNMPEIPITIQRSDYYTNILEGQKTRINRIVTKEEKPNINLGVKSVSTTSHLQRSVNYKRMKDLNLRIAVDKSDLSVNKGIIAHTQPQETNIIQPQKTPATCNKKNFTPKQKSNTNVIPKKLKTKPGTESKYSRNCVAAILERENLNEHNIKTNKEESNRNSAQMANENTDLKNFTMQRANVMAYVNFTKIIEERGNRKSYKNLDLIKSVPTITGEETDGYSKTQNAGNKFNKPSQKAEYKEKKDNIRIQPQCNERKDIMARIEHPKWSDLVKKSKTFHMSTSLIDLLCNGGLKIKSNINAKNIIRDYLTVHKLVIVNLIRVISEINSLEVFTSAVRCLYQILISSHLLDEGEIFNVTHYMKPIRFTSLLNSISTIHVRFSSDKKFKTIAVYLYTKLVKIINAACKAQQCRIEIRKISKGPLKCLCILLQQQHNKDIIISLLDIFKIVCHCRSNCLFLSYKEFYDSLYASYQLTQKLNTVISILRLIARKRSSRVLIGHQEKMISLLLEFINDESKISFKRCAVIKMLHKIANDEKGLDILLRYENYNKLYNYFINCKDKQYRCRMKVYSILNRLNTVVLTNNKLYVDLHLPDYILKYVNIHKEDKNKKEDSETDADSDESSDENDDDNDSSSSDELIKNGQDSRMLNIKSLPSMEKYFCEYFSHPNDNNDAIKFRIYENRGMSLDSYTIQQRINRSQNLGGVAFPDAVMLAPEIDKRTVAVPEFPLEYLTQKLKCLNDNIQSEFTPRVVFDLDELYQSADPVLLPQPNTYKPVNHCSHPKSGGLIFESRFECGNLRKATHIGEFEYDLQLSPDTLTSRGFQWFYFQVSNMLSGTAYTFNIINFTKDKNLYNEGMLPVVFSTTNYILSGIGWRRAGGRVVFHGNHYTNETGNMQYKTLTFSIVFPFMCDHVYMAYHYPYTYTRLMAILSPCIHLPSAQIYSRVDKLCNTVNNANEVPLLTVTAALDHPKSLHIPFNKRPIIILTARVHPGETNASWIMEGMIQYLLSETNAFAALAREYYIFKLIPMLNPEGVIYGNTRCGLLGEDLNRCWAKPSDTMCPEIYFTKKIIEFAKGQSQMPIGAYIDIHGHSKNRFFFLYGCNPKLSWNRRDRIKGNWANTLQVLPKAIQNLNPNIQLSYCKNGIIKSREKTGRVVMWRQLGITHSYTLECSFAECWKKQSVNPKLLTEIGESVIAALGNIADRAYKAKGSISSLNLDYKNLENGDSIQPTEEITQQPPSNFCNTSSPPTGPLITM